MDQTRPEPSRSAPHAPLLGPAVPARATRPAEPSSLPEPLAPFFAGTREPPRPASEPEPELASEPALGGYEELPWLSLDEPEVREEPAPAAEPAAAPEREPGGPRSPGADDGLPAFLGGVPEVRLEEEPVEIGSLAPDEVVPTPAAPAPSAQPAAWTTPLPEPAQVAAQEPGQQRSAALEEVAARLERIARALRDGSPGALLGDTADPLQALVAGYALGLAEGRAPLPSAGGGEG